MAQDFEYKDIKDAGKYAKKADAYIATAKEYVNEAKQAKKIIASGGTLEGIKQIPGKPDLWQIVKDDSNILVDLTDSSNPVVTMGDGAVVKTVTEDVTFLNGMTYNKDNKERTITIPPAKGSNEKEKVIGRYDYIQEVGGGTYAWEKQWDDNPALQPNSVRNAFKRDLETKYSDMKDAFSEYKKALNGDDDEKKVKAAASLASKYNLLNNHLKKVVPNSEDRKNLILAWMPSDFEKIKEQAEGQDRLEGSKSDAEQWKDFRESDDAKANANLKKVHEKSRGKGYLVEFALHQGVLVFSGVKRVAKGFYLSSPRDIRNRFTSAKEMRDKVQKSRAEEITEKAESGSLALQEYADNLVDELENGPSDSKEYKEAFDNFKQNNKGLNLNDLSDLKDATKREMIKQILEQKITKGDQLTDDEKKIKEYIHKVEESERLNKTIDVFEINIDGFVYHKEDLKYAPSRQLIKKELERSYKSLRKELGGKPPKLAKKDADEEIGILEVTIASEYKEAFDNFVQQNTGLNLNKLRDLKDETQRTLVKQELKQKKQNNLLTDDDKKILEYIDRLEKMETLKDGTTRQKEKKRLEEKSKEGNSLSAEEKKELDYINALDKREIVHELANDYIVVTRMLRYINALELQNIATNLTKTLEESRATLEDITALPKSDPNKKWQYFKYHIQAENIVKSMIKSGLFEEIGKDGKNKLGITQQAQGVLILNGKGQSKTIEQAKGELPHEYQQDAGL